MHEDFVKHGMREEAERKAREQAERTAKEEEEDAERKEKEDAERKAPEEARARGSFTEAGHTGGDPEVEGPTRCRGSGFGSLGLAKAL